MKISTALSPLFALGLASASACGASTEDAPLTSPKPTDTPAQDSPSPQNQTTTPAAEPIGPASGETPASSSETPATGSETPATSATRLTVTLGEVTGGESGAPTGDLSLEPSRTENAIVVRFENLSHYCKPTPSFDAHANDSTLELSVKESAAPVSKCFGPFAGELTIADLDDPSAITEVALRASNGKELARVEIPAGE